MVKILIQQNIERTLRQTLVAETLQTIFCMNQQESAQG